MGLECRRIGASGQRWQLQPRGKAEQVREAESGPGDPSIARQLEACEQRQKKEPQKSEENTNVLPGAREYFRAQIMIHRVERRQKFMSDQNSEQL